MKGFKTPTAVTTLILTLITVLFWAGFEIYRSFTIKPAPPVPVPILKPLNPTLDTKSLDSLQSRIFLDDSQIGTTVLVTATPNPTLTPSPTATASPLEATTSASPSVTPTSTP
jgi:hypothetical protein